MTKKDYIIVANCLNLIYAPAMEIFTKNIGKGNQAENRSIIIIATIQAVLETMFEEFPKDNPKFDWQQFKKAVYK